MPSTSRKTKKFALTKKMIKTTDSRLKDNGPKQKEGVTKTSEESTVIRMEKPAAHMFLNYNTALGPPYHILIDTNFINFSISKKLDLVQGAMDCLLAKCHIYITDCVMGELEKLGLKFRVALRVAKDPRFERLVCDHKGTYADDCLVERVKMHGCYIIATCDTDLKRRIRKIPGIPIMFVSGHKYQIERLPAVNGARLSGK